MRVALILGLGLVALAGCGKRAERDKSGEVQLPAVVIEQPKPEPAPPPGAPGMKAEDPFAMPAFAKGSDRREKRQPYDDLYPLPQDLAKAARLREERRAAHHKATVEVFKQSEGAKGPGAAEAVKAMEAYARRLARQHLPLAGVEHQEFLDAVRAAVAARCDDPLIRYWQVRFVEHVNPDDWVRVPPAKTAEGFRGVLDRLPKMPYPPAVRAPVAWAAYAFLQQAAAIDPRAVPGEDVDAAEKEFWRIFEELASVNDRISHDALFEVANLVGLDYQARGLGRLAGWQKVDRVMEKAKTAGWLRQAVEGQALIQAAWEARGGGFADTVPQEAWKLFTERLTAAKDRLERSWQAEPTFPLTGVAMVTVAMGLSMNRGEMEVWFRRAMEADPDCLPACRAKAAYLLPQWFGSRKEQFEFGYQCYRTRNWYAHLPLLLDLGSEGGFPLGEDVEAYYGNASVFEDMQALYEGYLAEYPTDRWGRTRFALLLVVAGRPALAAPHFETLGERPWAFVFPSRALYEAYKGRAVQAAKPKVKDPLPVAPPPRVKEEGSPK
jgi:hypothetical protein